MIVGLVIVMVLIAGVVGFSFYVSVQMARRNVAQGRRWFNTHGRPRTRTSSVRRGLSA